MCKQLDMIEDSKSLKPIAIKTKSADTSPHYIMDCLQVILCIIAISAVGIPWFGYYDGFILITTTLVFGGLFIGIDSYQDIRSYLKGTIHLLNH